VIGAVRLLDSTSGLLLRPDPKRLAWKGVPQDRIVIFTVAVVNPALFGWRAPGQADLG